MKLNATQLFAGLVLSLPALTLLSNVCLPTACAQRPVRHELIRGDMPPGLAASYYQMNNRSLVGHVQPVQVVVPPDSVIEVGGNGGYGEAVQGRVSVGMMIGPVYRFKVSNLPIAGMERRELYPSIEVINRLHPPQGLENEFPIQVVISRDDLLQAAQGRMVTKVVYLEDPRGTLPHKHVAGQQPSFDIDGGADPLREAEQLGRPMAILRMGSRVPMPGDPAERFDFGSPMPTILPNPSPSGDVTFDRSSLKAIQAGSTQDAANGIKTGPTQRLRNQPPVPVREFQLPLKISEETKPPETEAPETAAPKTRQSIKVLPPSAALQRSRVRGLGNSVASEVARVVPRRSEKPAAVYGPVTRSIAGASQTAWNRSQRSEPMDDVARAAQAQYAAAVAEMAQENRIRATSGHTEFRRPHVTVEPPAPDIQSDVTFEKTATTKNHVPALRPLIRQPEAASQTIVPAQRLMPRRPDQLNRF